MSGVALWLGGLMAVLVAANVVITRRLWRSPLFERSQKIAQTALIWLVPGSCVFVKLALSGGAPKELRDPTAHSPEARGDVGDLGHSHSHDHDGR
jgi:hypothetical protein